MAVTGLSAEDAERLRSFERRVHDAVSAGYYDFFTPITLLASEPLLDAAPRSGLRSALLRSELLRPEIVDLEPARAQRRHQREVRGDVSRRPAAGQHDSADARSLRPAHDLAAPHPA